MLCLSSCFWGRNILLPDGPFRLLCRPIIPTEICGTSLLGNGNSLVRYLSYQDALGTNCPLILYIYLRISIIEKMFPLHLCKADIAYILKATVKSTNYTGCLFSLEIYYHKNFPILIP
jgi:hypothetical protein